MNDTTDLWMVDTKNLSAVELDELLNLTWQSEEFMDPVSRLYMTETNYEFFNTTGNGLLAAWDAEPGHSVIFLTTGDVNHDNEVNGLDIDPFVDVVLDSRFDVAADMNGDGAVNGLDVDPFVAAVVGGNAEPIAEPSSLLLALVSLVVAGGLRRFFVKQ